MVNLSYRNVPALQKAAQMVRDGAIGTIRHFEASYLQSWLTQPAWGHWDREPQWLWRLSTKHGSKGVLGDVGIHILDFATFIAGMDATQVSCLLQTFDKAPGGQIGDYVLDANDSATMQAAAAGERRAWHGGGDAVCDRASERPAAAALRPDRRAGGDLREDRQPPAGLPWR